MQDFNLRLSRRSRLLFGASLLLVITGFSLFESSLRERLSAPDTWFYDAMLRATSSKDVPTNTVIVDIDEASLNAMGQWPWPRYRIADLIQKIAGASPAAIAMDVVLPEPDRTSLDNIRSTLKKDLGITIEFSGMPPSLRDSDGFLGQAMAKNNVVGATYFYFDHVNAEAVFLQPGMAVEGNVGNLDMPRATGLMLNQRAISSQTRANGFINVSSDPDGFLRSLPLLINYQGVVYPSLGLATAMRALGTSSIEFAEGLNGKSLLIGKHEVPIDSRGSTRLRFDRAGESFRTISAVDVAKSDAPLDVFKNKTVFIGTSAVGLKDIHATPIDKHYAGVNTHAAFVDSVTNDRQIRVPGWSSICMVVVTLLLGIIYLVLLQAGKSLRTNSVFTFAAVAAIYASVISSWLSAGIYLPLQLPVITLAILLLTTAVAQFVRIKRQSILWKRKLEHARQVTIESMASVAESRDPETGAHIKRTQHYVKAIAEQLKASSPIYKKLLTPEYIELLYISAPLHDIGKVGVPDRILLKPGRLTEDEMTQMKKHAEFGLRIIESASENTADDNFLITAGEIAANHHERWDGKGYPLGKAGHEIPLAGRIMSIADVYDALISRRIYKEPFTHVQAMEMMHAMSGKNFDPEIFMAFCIIENKIIAIADRYRDEAQVLEPTA